MVTRVAVRDRYKVKPHTEPGGFGHKTTVLALPTHGPTNLAVPTTANQREKGIWATSPKVCQTSRAARPARTMRTGTRLTPYTQDTSTDRKLAHMRNPARWLFAHNPSDGAPSALCARPVRASGATLQLFAIGESGPDPGYRLPLVKPQIALSHWPELACPLGRPRI